MMGTLLSGRYSDRSGAQSRRAIMIHHRHFAGELARRVICRLIRRSNGRDFAAGKPAG
jgi:hypothetical protein